MSRVLVAGCGYVGGALAAELAAGGHSVIGLKRRPEGLAEGVTPFAADLLEPGSLSGLPSDIEQVVYAVSAGGRTPEAYENAYVRGLDNLLNALVQRGGVQRLLFTSSTAVYGQNDGSWVDETSPAEPARFTGETLLRAEALTAQGAPSTCSVRLSGIYGPSRTWLVRRVQSGEVHAPEPGEPPRYGNRVHRDDCAGLLAHLLAADEVPPVVIGVDDAPAPLSEVHRFVADLLDVPHPTVGPRDRARGGNKRCRNAAMKAAGYTLRVPSYREGYPEIVSEHLASEGAS
ncbi:MAG: NAD-dependent epimerase/dehydratase family protein [Sandaracinaceae bacterium]